MGSFLKYILRRFLRSTSVDRYIVFILSTWKKNLFIFFFFFHVQKISPIHSCKNFIENFYVVVFGCYTHGWEIKNCVKMREEKRRSEYPFASRCHWLQVRRWSTSIVPTFCFFAYFIPSLSFYLPPPPHFFLLRLLFSHRDHHHHNPFSLFFCSFLVLFPFKTITPS